MNATMTGSEESALVFATNVVVICHSSYFAVMAVGFKSVCAVGKTASEKVGFAERPSF